MVKSTIKENLEDFIQERLNESYCNLIKRNSYKKFLEEFYMLTEEIERKLANDKLWENFQIKELDLYSFQLEEAYKTGFYDSVLIFTKKNDNV